MTDIVLNRGCRYQLQQQLKHAQDASLYRRTLAILELDQGKPVAEVANALGVTRQTIYNWVESYAAAYDPLALVDAARSGRPSSWTPPSSSASSSMPGANITACGSASCGWPLKM